MSTFKPLKSEEAVDAADRVAARDQELMHIATRFAARRREIGEVVDERIASWVSLLLLIWSVYQFGLSGFVAWLVIYGSWTSYLLMARERKRGLRKEDAVGYAQQYVRLTTLVDLARRSNLRWKLASERPQSTETVVTFEEPEDYTESFWKAVEKVLPEFESMSPRERKNRLKPLVAELAPSLDDAADLAKREGVRLAHWLLQFRPTKTY